MIAKQEGKDPDKIVRYFRLGVLGAIAVTVGVAIWSAMRENLPAEDPPRVISLYGFSILGSALEDGVFPAFRDEWEKRTGERVQFAATFAASGRLVDEILREVPVDVAILASEIDADRLGAHGFLLGRPWGALPNGGVPCRTPLVLLTRPGNPLGLRSLADLGGDGVFVVMPDPATSGAGEWVLASLAGCAEGAEPLTEPFLRNVTRRVPSAREALDAFLDGEGDAMLAYEQQARALPAGAAETVYPECTALVEPIVVKLLRNVKPADAELVDAFVAFLWSEPAQRAFAAHGFRRADAMPVAGKDELADVTRLLTVESLGGVRAIEARIRREAPRRGA